MLGPMGDEVTESEAGASSGETAGGAGSSGGGSRGRELPGVRTSKGPREVTRALEEASRRGRLPGFEAGAHGGLFAVAAFGKYFDQRLVADVASGKGEGEGEGTRLRFRAVTPPTLPVIFVVVMIATVWPGLPLTQSLMNSYFPSIAGWTPWWYLPLTVLSVPFVLRKLFRDSFEAAHESSLEAIGKIAREIDGVVESAG